MLLTTLRVGTTLLVKKLLIFVLIVSVNLLITVLVSKDSLYSTQLEEVPDQDLDHFFLKDFQLIMVRSQSLVSPFTHLPKFQLLLLNHITPS